MTKYAAASRGGRFKGPPLVAKRLCFFSTPPEPDPPGDNQRRNSG
jgi:hypothetical protein